MFLSGTRFEPARAGIKATIVGCFSAIKHQQIEPRKHESG
jgi:hypothetical protein